VNIFIIAIFGLCIGSFLNVCIFRIPRKLSIYSPLRSFCPNCQAQLAWWENIPVLSWLLLRAKCSRCRAPINGQYPLVEMLSAIAAVASYFHFGLTPTGVAVYALVAVLILVTFIDLEFKIIPNVISFSGIIIGCCLSIVSQFTHLFSWPLTEGTIDSLLGILGGGGFFYIIGIFYYAISKRDGLGGGDIKLMGLTGAVLGAGSVVPIIFAGSLFGAIAGILTVYIRGGTRHSEIPFGPWLSLGAVLYIFANVSFFRVFY
jgi:leader peptidase (prepilin peptidase) / N-methyltransferase